MELYPERETNDGGKWERQGRGRWVRQEQQEIGSGRGGGQIP